MKHVAVLIRSLPLNSVRAAEGLRAALGQTLGDHAVIAVFMDDGAWGATELCPRERPEADTGRHVETLAALGHRLVVDEASLRARAIAAVRPEVEVVARSEAVALLAAADTLLAF